MVTCTITDHAVMPVIMPGDKSDFPIIGNLTILPNCTEQNRI